MDAMSSIALWLVLVCGIGLFLLLGSWLWIDALERLTKAAKITRYVIAYYRHREKICAWWAEQERIEAERNCKTETRTYLNADWVKMRLQSARRDGESDLAAALAEVEVLRAEVSRLEGVVHPWYGPCDGLGADGGCSECQSVEVTRKVG